MAPATNWLSFSLSPLDMLRPSQPVPEHPSQFMHYEGSSTNHYFIDNFYGNGWSANSKEVETSMHGNFMDPLGIHHQSHHAPKLEDFLGENSCHTETTQDDSSLTHIYDHHHHAVSYFNRDYRSLKPIAGIPTFSTNSGSEVDDNSVVPSHQSLGNSGEYIVAESGRRERALGARHGLSLGVGNGGSQSLEKSAVVSVVESGDCTKKIVDTFGQRTSIYRGVTRHRWTGRYEAHLWDNSCRREGQARKGRQVYLGGYDKEEKAAIAYDLAALKYWGPSATTNFPVSNYSKELEEMKYISKQEFIASLRRKSSGFSRGASIYRGVTRHHQQGRWQARIGRVAGNKDLYLGTFATEEEAAEAYDIAAIKFRGLNAVTNFEMSRYDVEAIMKSALPIGGAAKRLKLAIEPDQKPAPSHSHNQHQCSSSGSNVNFNMQPVVAAPCGNLFDGAAPFYHHASIFHHLTSSGSGFGGGGPAESSPCPMTATSPATMVAPSEFLIWPPHHQF